ncbi:Ser/Thr protein phosphatase family [Phyllosticta citriasiana]|uniref:Ser/Thr protein phosphatase family n=1 Tax=Phyllosticta citriasiana TaxID=595635 RepID=UPI0030FD9A66
MAGDKDRSSALSDDDIPLAAGARGREWQQNQQRRPLIDMVTNEWQKNLFSDSDEDDDFFYAEKRNWYTPAVITLLIHGSRRVPRRVQRTVCLGLGFLVAIWLGWRWILQPYWHEQTSFAEAVSGNTRWGVYGSNARPSFDDMVHVKQLDPSLLPSSAADNQRLVFVGDVHGCKDELVELLAKVNFHPTSDHLILTGDMVSKGPDSPGVVDLARDMQASCVRGNHEDRVLLTHKSLKMALADANSSKTLSEDEVRNAGAKKDKTLARSLNGKQIEWLQQCPVILRVGSLPGMGQIVVAHAGLVPGIELERQDPYQVMNMRSVDLETKVPSEGRDYAPWDKYWNFFMSHVPNPDNRMTIVYGHDSKRGLNIRKHSRGIDTGCVRGGKLTALVVEADSKGGPVQQSIVDVKCKDYSKNKDKNSGKKEKDTKGQALLEEEEY